MLISSLETGLIICKFIEFVNEIGGVKVDKRLVAVEGRYLGRKSFYTEKNFIHLFCNLTKRCDCKGEGSFAAQIL